VPSRRTSTAICYSLLPDRYCCLLLIITITPLIILSEDELGDLERLYEACQAKQITDEGLFTDTGVNERGENERQMQVMQ